MAEAARRTPALREAGSTLGLVLILSQVPRGLAELKKGLRERGFTVRSISRVAQLLRAIDQHRPAALILDEGAGGPLTLESLRLAKKIYPQLLVCVMASPEMRERLDETGGGEFLNRSLPGMELAGRVRLYLQRHQVVQENLELHAKVWQTEAYLAHILDQVKEAVITTDLHGVVKSLNAAAQDLLDLKSAALIGRTLGDIPVEGEGCANLNQVVMRALGHNSCEGRFLLAPVLAPPVAVYIRASTYVENTKRQGIILLLRDLTQQEEMEMRLGESERLAALGQIAAGMAHEIRNPLTSIGGLVRRLDKRLAEDHSGKLYLPHILDNIKRMEDMVREIDGYLDFVQSADYTLEGVEIAGLVGAALDRVAGMQPLAGIAMHLEIAPGLAVEGNRRSLTELFFQIIHNACEAMAGGGDLWIGGRREGAEALLSFRDTGPGIPLENLGRVYQPFFTTKLTGAGMGLTKAYMIAERHRGRIVMQSRPGQGTTFVVHLPLAATRPVRGWHPRPGKEKVDSGRITQ